MDIYERYIEMSGARYVPISESEMDNLLVSEMEFTKVDVPAGYEFVYERQVETKSGKKFPYTVRIYSSIVRGESRGCGEDAIRVVLVDHEKNRVLKLNGEKGKAGQRIYRTKNALSNLKDRCREYFRKVISEGCPNCGAVMAERKGKNGNFLGCTRYPDCNGTRNISH
jgi:hypothetical protein